MPLLFALLGVGAVFLQTSAPPSGATAALSAGVIRVTSEQVIRGARPFAEALQVPVLWVAVAAWVPQLLLCLRALVANPNGWDTLADMTLWRLFNYGVVVYRVARAENEHIDARCARARACACRIASNNVLRVRARTHAQL
jgi:hypothetical protein